MRYEPYNAVTRIADAGMRAMEAEAQLEGVELDDSMIFVAAKGVPAGEENAATHPFMVRPDEPEPVDVLASCCAHVQELAESIGIPLRMTVDMEDVRR